MASFSIFYRFYFGEWSSDLADLVPLVPSRDMPNCFSNSLNKFSDSIPICYKNFYVNSFFLRTARLWNSLSAEWFTWSYDLNDFKSRVKRQLSFLFYYYIAFLNAFHFFLLFLSNPFRIGLFGTAPSLSKICCTYPTMTDTVTLYLKNFQNMYINHVTHLSSSINQKSAIFAISGNANKNCILKHFF